ncbi:MAG: RepB family plasmid replication initiator protein [Cetobacterium sp.]
MKHSEVSFEKFNLFTAYSLDGDSKKIRIKVSEKFEYISNEILGNYTKFDLIDFVRLRTTYSKNLFKLLKQWDSVKEFKVSDKYTTANFNTRVLGQSWRNCHNILKT